MKNKTFYIVVSNYSEENSKRQPWYTVRHLVEVILSEYKVVIINSLRDVPTEKNITIIKFWSIKDLYMAPKKDNRLIYLMSFPLYSFLDLIKYPKKLIENRKDIWKILIVSLIPKFLLRKAISKSELVVFNSDRAYNFIGKGSLRSINYYPFFKGNWSGYDGDIQENINFDEPKIGYFGPPFTSRGIDDVIKLFNSKPINSKANFKLIVRTERTELEHKLLKFKKKIKPTINVDIVDGFLNREDLYKALNSLDVIVLPFSFVFSELPIVVLEAIELNKIVITTSSSGLEDLISSAPNCLILPNSHLTDYSLLIREITKAIKTKNKDTFFQDIEKTNNLFKELLCQN